MIPTTITGFTSALSDTHNFVDGELVPWTGVEFADMFAYHLILDRDCCIVRVGAAFKCDVFLRPTVLGAEHVFIAYRQYIDLSLIEQRPALHRIFNMRRPMIPCDYESIVNVINSLFVLQVGVFARSLCT